MSNLKSLRLKINSIKSTQKITKAMQMVAASKLRIAKISLSESMPYANTLSDVIYSILNYCMTNDRELSYFANRVFGKVSNNSELFVIVTSERGLCSGFNASVLRRAGVAINALKSLGQDVKIVTIGKKATNWVQSFCNRSDVLASYECPSSKDMVSNIVEISKSVTNLFKDQSFTKMSICSSKFVNTTSQIANIVDIAPIDMSYHNQDISQVELEGANIIEKAIEMYIQSKLYLAILESKVGEEAARMVAMDNATNNAKDIIYKLTLDLNRHRQSLITKELIEIISGAEAV